jgi:GPH family glycoside/pentoside/hexuronide:cation symporter
MEETEIVHSGLNMASYGFAKFLSEFIEMAFTTWGFIFYEVTLKLDPLLVGLGYALFAVWNAINDPLLGYLTNRPFKFTRKWGRRFPWILIGGIPYILCYILIFTPPMISDPVFEPWILFGWLLFATCLFDTFNSIFFINYVSLFPDKFRSVKERRKASGIATPIGIVGIALGALLPPIFIIKTSQFSFILQAAVISAIGLLVIMLAIPGCREDRSTINKYLDKHKVRGKEMSFWKALRTAMKQSNFRIFIVSYTLYRCLIISIQASIPYVVGYVLGEPERIVTYISAGFLIGALISSPFWAILAQRRNNNKMVMVISSFLLIVFTIPLMFVNHWSIMFLVMIFWGVGEGGYWTLIAPVLADVIDESVVLTQKRQEGIYNGFLQFFGRLGILFQAATFAIIHVLTGFDNKSPIQSPEALFGIELHFVVIPTIVMLIGAIIFWKYYKLTPDKVAQHQARVDELKL